MSRGAPPMSSGFLRTAATLIAAPVAFAMMRRFHSLGKFHPWLPRSTCAHRGWRSPRSRWARHRYSCPGRQHGWRSGGGAGLGLQLAEKGEHRHVGSERGGARFQGNGRGRPQKAGACCHNSRGRVNAVAAICRSTHLANTVPPSTFAWFSFQLLMRR